MNILGIDIGGSGIKGAPVNVAKGVLLEERFRIPTPQPSSPAAVVEAVQEIVAQFNYSGPIGCGFPAPILNGVAKTAANIDNRWIDVNVEQAIKEATGFPTYVVNDADAAGVGEFNFGAGKGRKGVVMVLTIGTGIGSALFIDGQLVPNTEFGHMLFRDGVELEKYASDAVRKAEGLDYLTWGKRLNEVLNYLSQLFYPELIIIGGGTSKRMDNFMEVIDVPTEILPARTLNQAGIIGAAWIAAHQERLIAT